MGYFEARIHVKKSSRGIFEESFRVLTSFFSKIVRSSQERNFFFVRSALSLFIISLPYALTISDPKGPSQVYTPFSSFSFAMRNGQFTGFGSAGIQTQVGKTWEKRRKRLREDLTNLNQFDRFHIKKILRRSTSCALHVAICYPMLPIFRIFLTFWFYILVQWDLVRCSEAKQGMLRQRWAGFGIASAATSPWHGQDSAGNLDEPGWTWGEPGVNLGDKQCQKTPECSQNVHRMKEDWTAMNSDEQHQNLREMWLRFYFKLKRWVGWDQIDPVSSLLRHVKANITEVLADWCH